jgi:NAD(P)-dependent dehydrogenase (short-subunit alcohol dehydrogenase family)
VELGLKNKVVAVTGGSKGIGLACAKAFMAESARVVIVSRSQANLDAAARELPGVVCVAAHLAQPSAAPEDVADLTLFLASAKAGCITGAIVPIDGGSNPVL